LRFQLRICITHVVYQYGEQTIHERLFLIEECISVADGTTQNTADYVSGFGIRGQLSVCNGERDGTYMIGYNTHGYVCLSIVAIMNSGQVANYFYNGLEHICVVVGCFSLQSHAQTLESHTGIDYLSGKRFEISICFPVVLHEHKVPYFNDLRMIVVNQIASVYFSFFFSRT